jgi:hypothetical protein
LKKRFFAIKWLNDLLPFQSRMHKFAQSSLAGCPEECGCDSEDHPHLLHCPASHRIDLFLQLGPDLETLFDTHKIDPHLRKVMLMLVAPYWGEAFDFDLPAEYEELFSFQSTLHADSLFMGCLSVDWATFQHAYLKLNHFPRQKGQASTGIKALVSYLLNFVHSVWLVRNGALHGDDTTTQLLSYKHTQLLLDIQDLYDQASSMLASDRDLFVHPYDYWLDKTILQLNTFLRRMRTTVKVSVAQAADMGANFRTIDSYFRPTIPLAIFDVILGTTYIPPEPD